MRKVRLQCELWEVSFSRASRQRSFCSRIIECRQFLRILLLIAVVVCMLGRVGSAVAWAVDTSADSWAFLSGYGQSVPGWGQTTQRVETIDLIPRYNHVIFDNLGAGWYHGYHSLMLEVPFSFVVSPGKSAMVGVNFLAAYTFTSGGQWQPYVFGGGGPVYSFADIPGMGADLNGNYQFGAGLKYDWQVDHQLLFELRYHHISNAGTEDPNDPLNSMKVLVGFTF